MHILGLKAENVLRLKAVQIRPDKSVVVVGGPNEAGKSSTLDSIMIALGGAGRIPAQPVHKGAKKGTVQLELGDVDGKPELIVTRTLLPGGGGTLVVTNGEGWKCPGGPQAILDKLCGQLTFDPLEFERMKPKEQGELLRRLVGLDTSDLDERRQIVYDERTLVNREAKVARMKVDELPHYDDAPAEPVSVADLMAELRAAEEAKTFAAQAEQALTKARAKADKLAAAVVRATSEVDRLQNALVLAQEALRAAEDEAQAHAQALGVAEDAAESARAAVPDTSELHGRLASAEEVNGEVRANQAWEEARRVADRAEAKADSLTNQIQALDVERAERIARLRFPVPGLGVENGEVTYEGLPFAQAASSVRLRVSVAIGFSMNPKLKVLLVRDGSLLDSAHLKLIAEMAEEAGAQVWLEQVMERDGDGKVPERCSVYIEDGAVVVC